MAQDRRKKKMRKEKFNGTAIDLPDWQEILDAAGGQIKDAKHKKIHAELRLGAQGAFNPAKAGTPDDWVAVRTDQYELMLHYALAGGYVAVPDVEEMAIPEVPPPEAVSDQPSAVSEDPHAAGDVGSPSDAGDEARGEDLRGE